VRDGRKKSEHAMPTGRKRFLRDYGPLLAILVFAAVTRIAFLIEAQDTLLLRVPLLDGRDYDIWARELLSGDWGVGAPYFYAPLYPHVLALVYAIFGPGGLAMVTFQLVLGVLAVWLTYRLALRLTDRTTALVAAALHAGYGPPVLYAGLLLVASLLTVLTLLAALALIRTLDRPTPGRWLVFGAAVGLAALGRGNLLYLAPAGALLLLQEPIARSGRLRLMAALTVGVALVIAPVTLRNIVIGDDLVLISSNAGLNLRIGQQIRYGGLFGPISNLTDMQDDPAHHRKPEIEEGRGLRASQVSQWHTGAAAREAVADPLATARHYLRKAYRFCNGYEQPQITSWRVWRARLVSLNWLAVPYTLLAAGGLLGLLVLRGRARRVLAILVLGYFLSLWLFFPTARYRQPLAPLLAVSTAALLVTAGRAARRGERKRAAAWIGGLGLGMAAIWPGWVAMPHTEEFWQVEMLDASRAADAGEIDALLAAGERAEALLPDLAETPFRLSRYLERNGELQAALGMLERAQRRLPDHPLVRYRLGANLEQQGRLPEAAIAFAAAAEADTGWAEPHRARGRVLRRLGDPVGAIAALEEAVRREPGEAESRSNLALLLAETGRLEDAQRLLVELTTAFPDYLPGWFNLAAVEVRLGRMLPAREALQRAREAARRDASPAQIQQLEQLERVVERGRGGG